MRKYFTIIVILISFAACKKESVNSLAPIDPTVEPSIVSVTFHSVYEAGAPHPVFNVDLIADSNVIDKVILYMAPTELRWEVNKPTTGKYTMYDHIGEYPTYSQSRYYFFSFVKKDGTVLNMQPFQVY